MKLPKIFKWRLRLVQQGYDLGWEHGYEAGQIEKKHEIVDLLSSHIDRIDWLKETPLEVKDILPIVRDHNEEKEVVGWEQ